MLVIKVELWKWGNKEDAKEIGRMYIANDGTGSSRRGNYDAWICRKGSTERPPHGSYTRKGRVEDYPRKSYIVWKLIKRALNNIL